MATGGGGRGRIEGRGLREISAKIAALGRGVRLTDTVDVGEPGRSLGFPERVVEGVKEGLLLGMDVTVCVGVLIGVFETSTITSRLGMGVQEGLGFGEYVGSMKSPLTHSPFMKSKYSPLSQGFTVVTVPDTSHL